MPGRALSEGCSKSLLPSCGRSTLDGSIRAVCLGSWPVLLPMTRLMPRNQKTLPGCQGVSPGSDFWILHLWAPIFFPQLLPF